MYLCVLVCLRIAFAIQIDSRFFDICLIMQSVIFLVQPYYK